MSKGPLKRDSEGVRAYEGGSYRDRRPGKGIYKEIPPIALKRLAARYEYGELKYGQAGEFKKGLPVSDCWDSAMRHLVEYMAGDNSEDHLAAVAWNVFAMMYMETPPMAKKWQDIKVRRGLPTDEYSSYPTD